MDLAQVFSEYENEFLEFKRIKNPRHARPDLCAFLMLDDLLPGTEDMIGAGEHDEIWLSVSCNVLANVATKEFICNLRRCGVWYSEDNNSLSMFV